MLSLSLAFVLSRPATLTFSCPATRIEKLLVTLSEKTGVPLRTVAKFEGRFVVVRFKDTPVDDALSRLAKALGGKFVTQGNSRTLEADPASKVMTATDVAVEAVRKYFATGKDSDIWSAKEADELVAEALAVNDASQQPQDVWKKLSTVNARGPQHRLIRRVAKMIGEKALAGILPNTRAVYSSQPTRMQRALPPAVGAAVDQYLKEAKVQNEALEKKGITHDSPPQLRYYVESLLPAQISTVGYSQAVMVVKHDSGGINLELRLVEKDGTLGMSVNDRIELHAFVPSRPTDSQLAVEGEYKPSETSDLVSRAVMSSQIGQGSGKALSTEERVKIKAIFSDVEKNELLQFAPSEVLLQTAEKLDKDLVAEMSDMSIFVFAMGMMNKDNQLQNFFNPSFSPWSVEADDKGLTLKTSESFATFDMKLPRRAVGRFVTDVDKNGISIDAVADLIGATPRNEASMFIVMFACVPFDGLGGAMMRSEGESVLRIYAMLDPSARAKAKQGGYSVPYRALPPALQQAVEAYVFFEAESSPPLPIDLDSGSTGIVRVSNPGHDTTTVFPNGLQPDTLVTFRIRDTASLFTLSSYGDGPPMAEPGDEDAAARRIVMAEKTAQMEGRARSVKLALGRLKQLDMAVLLESKMGVQGRYQLLPNFKDSEIKDVDGMPEDMKKSLKEKVEKQRELYKDMQFGGPPGKIKP